MQVRHIARSIDAPNAWLRNTKSKLEDEHDRIWFYTSYQSFIATHEYLRPKGKSNSPVKALGPCIKQQM